LLRELQDGISILAAVPTGVHAVPRARPHEESDDESPKERPARIKAAGLIARLADAAEERIEYLAESRKKGAQLREGRFAVGRLSGPAPRAPPFPCFLARRLGLVVFRPVFAVITSTSSALASSPSSLSIAFAADQFADHRRTSSEKSCGTYRLRGIPVALSDS